MTGEGVVVSVSDEGATVRICKSSACSHDCTSCGACTNPTFNTLVKNPLGAKEGDRVVIWSDSGKILSISLLVYVVPVIFLIAAALICEEGNLSFPLALLVFATIIFLWVFLIRYANRHIHPEHTITAVLKD